MTKTISKRTTRQKKRIVILILIGIAGIGLNLWLTRPTWHGIPVTVVRVIDGDTIKVMYRGEETSVRLLGIDCLETRHTDKQKKQADRYGLTTEQVMRIGKEASEKAFHIIDGRNVTLLFAKPKPEFDYFRRLLAYVEVDDKDVGQILIEDGLADTYSTVHPRRSKYETARDGARDARKGMWGEAGLIAMSKIIQRKSKPWMVPTSTSR